MHDDLTPHRDNHEAAMARADLYKLANYSMKLFKMIQEGQELEGWVQAKVTKAADYIASVYHFMEYEMKTSEYGENLNNSDVYSESVRRVFQQRLTEAKAKAQAIKKKAMKDEKVEEGFPTVADAKKDHEEREKSKGTGKFEKKETKTGTEYTRKSSTFDNGTEDKPKEKKVKEGSRASTGSARDKLIGSISSRMKDTPQPQRAPKDQEEADSWARMKRDQAAIANSGKKKDESKMMPKGKKKTVKETGTGTAPAPMSVLDKAKALGSAVAPGLKKAAMTYGAMKALGVKEATVVPPRGQAAQPLPSGIPATATTTVPGMKATGADLKKANSSAALGEGKCNHSAKGKKCPVHGLKECGGSMYEVGMSPAPVPQKSGIPQKMTTTVPGMKVSPQDLKKQGVSTGAAFGEGKSVIVKKTTQVNEWSVGTNTPGSVGSFWGSDIKRYPEIEAIVKQMKPTDYVEYNAFDQKYPTKDSYAQAGDGKGDNYYAILNRYKGNDEFNFINRYNRDNNNLTVGQWLVKAKNKLAGAVTGKPEEKVPYDSYRYDQNTGKGSNILRTQEKDFPTTVKESADLTYIRQLMARLNG